MVRESPAIGELPACRACGQVGLDLILSLGRTPLANALLTEEQLGETEPTFPLELAYCPQCTLVQITETVSPELLFRDYAYFSSFSDTMIRHARDLAGRLVEERKLNDQSLVVELASNDGYLLRNYASRGIPVLGIEPARNIAQVARDRGVPTLCEFFGKHLAADLAQAGHSADLIHAHNVLAHVPDLNGVVAGFRILLHRGAMAVIEVPYLKDLFDHVEFDTIYHEHLSYFSLTALDRLFARHKLKIVDVERVPIHGGSLRVMVEHGRRAVVRPSVTALLEEEAAWVHDRAYYAAFGTRVARLRDELTALLAELKREQRRIAVYGASAKGSTLLNYFGIGRDVLEYVVDRSTIKQGRYTPGTHLKICDPARLLDDQPDFVLLLTWNFAAEILEQQAEYRQRGGRFIIPIPQLRVA